MEEQKPPFDSKLQHAFQVGLHISQNTDYESLRFANSPEWDSIAHMQLITAIEEEFGIMIDTNDMLAMNSYPKAKEIVKKNNPSLESTTPR